jgi:protein-S-isoprenylcysteine O-methyltransferase Ste14
VRRRVFLSYLGALVYLALARPSFTSLSLGAVLMLMGEGLRLWASGHIDKNVRLAQTGPYAHVRHPLYLGSALIGSGLAVASGSWAVGIGVLVALGILLGSAARAEERRLRSHFGQDYVSYSREVPALVPRLRPLKRGGRFDWKVVGKHRELRAVAGLAAGLLVLALKAGLW